MREPTQRQVSAVQMVVNGRSKAFALRAAGYSEAVATHPQRVFGSPTVVALMSKAGIGVERIARVHRNILRAERMQSLEFPKWRRQRDGETDAEYADKVMSEEDIRQFLADCGYMLQKIVHTQRRRVAYYWEPDSRAQLKALDLLFKVYGAYAPRRVQIVNPPAEHDEKRADRTA